MMNYFQVPTKKNILFSLLGFVFGTIVGINVISSLVPDARQWTKLYKDQKNLVSDLRNGKQAITNDMWLENAKSMRAKSDNEFVSDMINNNGTVILMNNRLQLRMYPSSEELRSFGEKVAENRKNEIDYLKKIDTSLLSR